MRLSKEIIDAKMAEAPVDVQEAVMSNDVAASLVDIGQQHDLHIDQLGILEEEGLYVMLGLTSPDEFFVGLRDRLGISSDEASKIVQDINERILIPIRSKLQAQPAESSPVQPLPKTNPEKDDILAEIENPTPVQQPISTTGGVPKVSPVSTLPAPSVTNEFLAGKMNETVNLPPQKYNADPYREPLS